MVGANMSDNKHTGESKITFWLDDNLIVKFDEAIKEAGYKNRAEWFREGVRDVIELTEMKRQK
jgi:metal-responsive CopG/Arc/MetJ family transcriptional regulator